MVSAELHASENLKCSASGKCHSKAYHLRLLRPVHHSLVEWGLGLLETDASHWFSVTWQKVSLRIGRHLSVVDLVGLETLGWLG